MCKKIANTGGPRYSRFWRTANNEWYLLFSSILAYLKPKIVVLVYIVEII